MLDQKKLADMLTYSARREAPKITITLPTHRKSPDNQQDKILYKNLLQETKAALSERYSRRLWEPLTDKLAQLLNETGFWIHTDEGLVVLGCDERVETFLLRNPVEADHYAGASFRLRPLFALDEVVDEFYLVDLSKDRIELYRAGMNTLDAVDQQDIETHFSDLFSDFDVDANLNVGTYSGLTGMHHGHHTKAAETEKEREKYFRYLDGKFEALHRTSGKRFILAGTADNLAVFKKLSQHRLYYDLTIEKPLSSLQKNELQDKIRGILQPVLDEARAKLETEIRKAEHDGKILATPDDIKKPVKAAASSS